MVDEVRSSRRELGGRESPEAIPSTNARSAAKGRGGEAAARTPNWPPRLRSTKNRDPAWSALMSFEIVDDAWKVSATATHAYFVGGPFSQWWPAQSPSPPGSSGHPPHEGQGGSG
jgi:hypothetical protein